MAIKIKKESESITEAIELLAAAGKKKKCSFTILIVDDSIFLEEIIPENMVIMKRYNIEAQQQIEAKIQ